MIGSSNIIDINENPTVNKNKVRFSNTLVQTLNAFIHRYLSLCLRINCKRSPFSLHILNLCNRQIDRVSIDKVYPKRWTQGKEK